MVRALGEPTQAENILIGHWLIMTSPSGIEFILVNKTHQMQIHPTPLTMYD